MTLLSVSVSSHPASLGAIASRTDGVELKLDWEHVDALLSDKPVSEHCREQGVGTDLIRSIHLPPGTNRRHGMAIAPGNTGTITDFIHRGLGEAVDPEWLTVHTVRRFDYREQVERFATVTDLTGFPIAVENTPDASYFHAPEELAFVAMLTDQVDRLADTYLLVDTAHVDTDRCQAAVDEAVIVDVLDRAPSELAAGVKDDLRQFVAGNLSGLEGTVPASDPWAPVLTTLYATGGERVRAVHLNHPVDDGLPKTGHDAEDGLDHVLAFCREHDIAVVLEPGRASIEEIVTVVEDLRERA
ncbi:hypothetical protein [Haloarchaeobius sp. HME9146]|uniref:hypothetical protein n=1 Tax=Haloarchaeobius sp. HME9146 TaxID=2978732 RepID=UPI0021C0EF2F|nr:hypothetical protein [Haloarchaeobius sp. HME9146]MCT9098258.1 hypothetical protein [Haloarchaeobius sp. HME9146]